MLLVLQIAAGIVLGFVILAYWRKILHVAVTLLVLAAVAAFLVWAKTASEQDLNTASWIVLFGLAYAAHRLVHKQRLHRAGPRNEEHILHNGRHVLAFLAERGEKGATAEEIIQGLGRAMDGGGPKPFGAPYWGKSSVYPALRALRERGLATLAEPISLGIWRADAEKFRIAQERLNFILAVLRERGDQGCGVAGILIAEAFHALETHSDALWQPDEVERALRYLEEQKLVEHSGELWRVVGAEPKPDIVPYNAGRVLDFVIDQGDKGATFEEIIESLRRARIAWGDSTILPALQALEKKKLIQHSGSVWRTVADERVLTFLRERGDKGATSFEEIIEGLDVPPRGSRAVTSAVIGTEPTPVVPKIENVPSGAPDHPIASAQ